MSDVIERLKKVFTWIEEWDLRVGDLWLHPEQIEELNEAKDAGWDKVNSLAVREATSVGKGGTYVAVLWGARVFESATVPKNHVAVTPDDMNATLVGSAACRPF